MRGLHIYLLLFFFFLLSLDNTYAQNQEIDSLKNAAKEAEVDSSKVKILNELTDIYWHIGLYDSALIYSEKSVQLATTLNFQMGLGKAYNNIGIVYTLKSDNKKALEFYNKAIEVYQEINYNSGIASCYNNMGVVFKNQGNYPEALDIYFKVLKILEYSKEKKLLANCHINIGTLYYMQSNLVNALIHYKLALKFRQEIGDQNGVASCKVSLGNIAQEQKDIEKAFGYYNDALKIFLQTEDKRGQIAVYSNLGVIYLNKGDYQKAYDNFNQTLIISEETGSIQSVSDAYLHLGKTLMALKKSELAKEFLEKSLELSLEQGIKIIIRDSYLNLSKVDSAQGNYQSAFYNVKMYNLYKDSLFNEENTKKLTRANMQFEFDKKIFADSLKQIEKDQVMQAKLGKQKAYTWSGLGITFLLIIFSMFIVRNNKVLAFERKKSDDLLLNILPEEVSQELKEKGTTTANHYDNVTVLFTDFVSFTKVSEQMDSQELVDELHACFKAFDEIISKYNIEKIKTIGDAYMAVSGLPQPVESHAQNIVNAALEIRDFMQQRKLEKGEHSFDIRLGVHSGSVVAGVVGVKKFAYDIWGDTVNTAARMEQNSETNKVNISATTHELIKDEFQFEYRGEIEAKNKGKLKMYFVER